MNWGILLLQSSPFFLCFGFWVLGITLFPMRIISPKDGVFWEFWAVILLELCSIKLPGAEIYVGIMGSCLFDGFCWGLREMLLKIGSFWAGMEKEGKNQRASETEFFLQWGSRKRLRCVRVRGPDPSSSDATRLRRKISSRFLAVSAKDAAFLPPRHTRFVEFPFVGKNLNWEGILILGFW